MSRLERWLALAVLVLVVGMGWMYARAGQASRAVRDAEAALAAAHDSTLVALVRVRALDSLSKRLIRAAEATRAPHVAATARTDTAAISLRAARDSALTAARDSAATAQELRRHIERLASAADSVVIAFGRERAMAATRIGSLTDAVGTLEQSGAAKDSAISRLQMEVAAANAVAVALKRDRPGFVHRMVNGALSAGAGAACYGVAAMLTGPIGAIGIGAGCAAIAGAALP